MPEFIIKMSAALCNVAPRAAAVGSHTNKKPLTSLEIRAPCRHTVHISHYRYATNKRSRSTKVKSSAFPPKQESIIKFSRSISLHFSTDSHFPLP